MNRKFYDWQWVRVIGADWCFRIRGVFLVSIITGDSRYRQNSNGWWPEYLLESAE